jgi:hypothetical protein
MVTAAEPAPSLSYDERELGASGPFEQVPQNGQWASLWIACWTLAV